MTHRVYILLGGNTGNVREAFAKATDMLRLRVGQIMQESPLYLTESWEMESDNMFINQALCLTSYLHPMKLIREIMNIEHILGRVRTKGVAEPRNIDIDILFIDEMIISEPGLEVPHPRLHLRRFALQPLLDIAPDLIHPIFNLRVKELIDICNDHLKVIQIPELKAGKVDG